MQLNAVVLHWPRRASAQRSAAEAARSTEERRFGTADGRAQMCGEDRGLGARRVEGLR